MPDFIDKTTGQVYRASIIPHTTPVASPNLQVDPANRDKYLDMGEMRLTNKIVSVKEIREISNLCQEYVEPAVDSDGLPLEDSYGVVTPVPGAKLSLGGAKWFVEELYRRGYRIVEAK